MTTDTSTFRIIPLYDMTQYQPLGDALDEIETSAQSVTHALEQFREKAFNMRSYWRWIDSPQVAPLVEDVRDMCAIAIAKEISFRPPYYSMRTLEKVSFQQVFQVHLASSHNVMREFFESFYSIIAGVLSRIPRGPIVLGRVDFSEIVHSLAGWMYDAFMLEFLVLTGYDKLYPAMVMNDFVLDLFATHESHLAKGLKVCTADMFGRQLGVTGLLTDLFDKKRAAIYPAMLSDVDTEELSPEVKNDYLTSANPPVLLNGGAEIMVRTPVLESEDIYCYGGIPVLKTRDDQWRLHVLSCCNAAGKLVRVPMQEGFLKDKNTYYPGEAT